MSGVRSRNIPHLKAAVRTVLVLFGLGVSSLAGVLTSFVSAGGDRPAPAQLLDSPGQCASTCSEHLCTNVTCGELDKCFGRHERSCGVATMYCNEPFSDGFVNYIKLHYCSLAASAALSFTVQIVCLLFLFVLLGSTADEWFVLFALNCWPSTVRPQLFALN